MPVQAVSAIKLPLMQSGGSQVAGTKQEGSFGQFLSKALDNVNDLQLKADQASTDLATGKIEDISQVVIAAEKASVALQLTIQVRNRALESYQEMMRMQV